MAGMSIGELTKVRYASVFRFDPHKSLILRVSLQIVALEVSRSIREGGTIAKFPDNRRLTSWPR